LGVWYQNAPVRNAILILLLVNLVFMAWTHWIDVPAEPVVSQADAHLPRLVLASEAPPGRLAPKGAVTAATPVTQPPAATPVSEASAAAAAPPAGHRCVSVGPFNDLAQETRAAGLLQQRGLTPQARTEPGEVRDGFWVYVAGIKSAADEAQVLRTLQEAGINDAHAIAPTADGRRVSVGLFIERPGAERRARAVEHLGFAPDIVDRHKPGSVYWVDLDLGSSDAAVPTEGLVPATEIPVKAEPRACAADQNSIRG
jgi:hypothetical protein